MLKDRNKRLTTISAIGLFSLLALSLLALCLRLGAPQPGLVAINILGSTVQSGSNIVTFLVTNAFEFPIRYAAFAQTKVATQNWRAVYNKGRSITLVRGQIPARSTVTFPWALPPTNRWRIEVPYVDPRNSVLRKRVQGVVWSPEMVGDSPIPPTK